jgi:electron-transferring-flavoprotein dehydrogenase
MEAVVDFPRQSMEVDIVCVGFGPATGGFLTTLSRALQDPDAQSYLTSAPTISVLGCRVS